MITDEPEDFSNEDDVNTKMAESVAKLFITVIMFFLFIKILFF
jgi:hypothetical protein